MGALVKRVMTDAEWAHLMAIPLDNPERPNLRDRVPLSGSKLETRARKFTSLRPESFWGSTWRKLQEPEPPLEQRLNAIARRLGLGTRNNPPKPFDSGRSCLPGMEKWMDAA